MKLHARSPKLYTKRERSYLLHNIYLDEFMIKNDLLDTKCLKEKD